MREARFHGRGGQGVVTGAELLSVAAFHEGKFAQAFPSFGSERTGAPVISFCRIDEREIRLREPVMTPDVVVVQDATLLHAVDVFQGLGEEGFVLVNTERSLDELGLGDLVAKLPSGHARAVPATRLAKKLVGRPLPNTALLGGLAALTRWVTLEAVQRAIAGRFAGEGRDANQRAAAEAYRSVEER